MAEKDGESLKPAKLPWLKMVLDQGIVNQDIIDYSYKGSGTEDDPYLVEWIKADPRNPLLWPAWVRWSLSQLLAVATLAVSFASSSYTGGISDIILELHTTAELAILGVCLFVVGFATGPLLWAPLCELYGRQYLYVGTYGMLTIFSAAACGAQNIQTLVILRFFAGLFGSSPLTNAGGVMSDIFNPTERGLAVMFFAAAPFAGPVLGPIIGGFVGESVGWRWVMGVTTMFTAVLWIAGSILVPETYAPVLLQRRAERLTKLSGGTKIYRSKVDVERGRSTARQLFKKALSRPWVLLFREPIVLLLSLYTAIIYGTLYMLFAAFPIVYQETRGWSPGIGGLAFLGVLGGMACAIAYGIWVNNRYAKEARKREPEPMPPEARLPISCVGGIAIPVGLFWFAWTNYNSIHWIVSILAGIPFGFGMVLVFLGLSNYLIDAYTVYAASALAANALLRSLFGAVFPLFTGFMYEGLGIHWASSVPGFLAVACVPFPFLFYRYGAAIRSKCKYAAEAAEFMRKMRERAAATQKTEDTKASDDSG